MDQRGRRECEKQEKMVNAMISFYVYVPLLYTRGQENSPAIARGRGICRGTWGSPAAIPKCL